MRIKKILKEPQPKANTLPDWFVRLLRILMVKEYAPDEDPERLKTLEEMNKPLMRDGYEN
ncbi:hypothetical protein ACLEW9_13655 [Enterobacter ludwigii]|uniref:hypothetical protein n=1 Tax=Enterobacter ludwigii TaxID=299767 RepID=UPI003976D496|nr:hypothetical protein [Enterobacter kobei]